MSEDQAGSQGPGSEGTGWMTPTERANSVQDSMGGDFLKFLVPLSGTAFSVATIWATDVIPLESKPAATLVAVILGAAGGVIASMA